MATWNVCASMNERISRHLNGHTLVSVCGEFLDSIIDGSLIAVISHALFVNTFSKHLLLIYHLQKYG